MNKKTIDKWLDSMIGQFLKWDYINEYMGGGFFLSKNLYEFNKDESNYFKKFELYITHLSLDDFLKLSGSIVLDWGFAKDEVNAVIFFTKKMVSGKNNCFHAKFYAK